MSGVVSPQFANLWYSFRRYYVDRFFDRQVSQLPPDALVLDLGGHRARKRGQFDIEQYPVRTRYANMDPTREPDFVCDASQVPVVDGCFDAVICSELLEHVLSPERVLEESHRVLRPGGLLLLAVPFNVNIHGHPQDYGRYTDSWFQERLRDVGFFVIEIETQGTIYTVSADMLKHFAKQNLWPQRPWARRLFHRAVRSWAALALRLEQTGWHTDNTIVAGYTTGFGVVAKKP